MSSPILLLCSLPPLAVLAVALVHGLRTRSAAVLATLSLAALILSAAVVLPLLEQDEAVRSPRLALHQDRGTGASASEVAHPVWLVRRSEPQTLYR